MMRMPRFAALAVLAVPLTAWAPAFQGGSVILDGKAIDASKIPESVPKGVRAAASSLEPWGAKAKVKIYISEKEPTVLAVPSGFPGAAGMLQKFRATREDYCQRFGQVLPDAALEVVYVESKEAFGGYVDNLVSREDYLKGWAAGAKETPGFWLHRPFSAAYFHDPKDPLEKKAEFKLENQLVHQFGHLLVNATLGRQPYWIQESVAWSLEQARENAIYAFCHRSGFVFKKEHGGWAKLGKSYLTAGSALPVDKIFSMDRQGEIPKELGAGAMVLTEFLASKHKEAWAKFAASMRAEYEGKTDPNFKATAERQRELFIAAFGDKALTTFVAELKR